MVKERNMSEEQEINYLDLNEFRNGGFLQEANRKFFHPLGLALSVIVEEDGTVTGLGPVWDYRDEEEGMFYGPDMINPEKIEKIEELRKSKVEFRKKVEDVTTDDEGVQRLK
jgi:hypothetical protein